MHLLNALLTQTQPRRATVTLTETTWPLHYFKVLSSGRSCTCSYQPLEIGLVVLHLCWAVDRCHVATTKFSWSRPLSNRSRNIAWKPQLGVIFCLAICWHLLCACVCGELCWSYLVAAIQFSLPIQGEVSCESTVDNAHSVLVSIYLCLLLVISFHRKPSRRPSASESWGIGASRKYPLM